MSKNIKLTRTAWAAFAALAAATILFMTVFLLLQAAMTSVAHNANALDDQRAEEAMRGALHMSVHHVTDLTEINSVWDEAVIRIYQPLQDATWLHTTYGALARADGDYDAVYVLDDKGRVLWGEDRQTRSDGGDITRFGPGAGHIFTAAGKLSVSDKPAGGIGGIGGKPAFIGIGLIQPSSDAVNVPAGRRYLMLVRRMDGAVLTGYGEPYNLHGAAFSAQTETPARPNIELHDASGTELGHLSWDARSPGLAAAAAVWPRLRVSLVLVAAMLAVLSASAVLGLRRLERSERRAVEAAQTDPLTGLPNRMAFLDCLRRRGRSNNLGVVCMDLDRFKEINETYGSEAADNVLQQLSQRMRQAVPADGFVARIGGDLFGFALWGPVAEIRTQGLADELHSLLSAPVIVGSGQITVVVSMGMAFARKGTIGEKEVFRRAQAALDQAKIDQRGGLLRYSDDIEHGVAEEMAVARAIREGLTRDEFEVVYQPIVEAGSGEINEVEALVRWPRHPGGALYPDQFIAVAEKHGLIHDLGMFVLRRACTDLAVYPRVRLGVNISPAQFRDPRFSGDVADILKATKFPPSRLELEVTEGYLIDLPEQAQAAIAGLHARGISIALDDFGTGYSSIGYLRRYAFDKLKIDKSLIDGMASDNESGHLVVATVALARALGITVTAEGVETAEQASLLRVAGCQNLQGYFFGRPQAMGDIATLLSTPVKRFAPRLATRH